MAYFVDAYGNSTFGFPLINLDLVHELQPVKGSDGKVESYRCIGAGGEVIGQVARYRIPGHTQLIPNTQPIRFLGVWAQTDDGTIGRTEMPVVAWVAEEDSIIEPAIPDVSVNDYPCWCLTDGRLWWIPGDRQFASEQEFVDFAVAKAKGEKCDD